MGGYVVSMLVFAAVITLVACYESNVTKDIPGFQVGRACSETVLTQELYYEERCSVKPFGRVYTASSFSDIERQINTGILGTLTNFLAETTEVPYLGYEGRAYIQAALGSGECGRTTNRYSFQEPVRGIVRRSRVSSPTPFWVRGGSREAVSLISGPCFLDVSIWRCDAGVAFFSSADSRENCNVGKYETNCKPLSLPPVGAGLCPEGVAEQDAEPGITERPTGVPSPPPTVQPTLATDAPTVETSPPTVERTTNAPTRAPTPRPTNPPTDVPTEKPTRNPTRSPTKRPTRSPTRGPTIRPTPRPSVGPTVRPTERPTFKPTVTTTPVNTESPAKRCPDETSIDESCFESGAETLLKIWTLSIMIVTWYLIQG